MKRVVRTLALVVLALVTVLVVVVVTRTVMLGRRATDTHVSLAGPTPFDAAAAVQHLSRAIQFQTVGHQDPAEDDLAAWTALHEWLQSTYPTFHGISTREVLEGRTLVFTWTGSHPSLAPIILMAHQDVVPAEGDALARWKVPPFSGAIAQGSVWGRGTVDDKGSLVALMEAAEALARRGFRPQRTVILVSGHDEETKGSGAAAAAELLKRRGVHAACVLDEGSFVLRQFPLTGKPVALIGVAEKGYGTLRVTVRTPGGHSSIPPRETGATTLARAVVAISEHQFPLKLDTASRTMLESLAPELPLSARAVVANTWLFGRLVVRLMASTPAGAASLHTTTAPTMLSASAKENVLPTNSIARINSRILPGDTTDTVMARAREALTGLPATLTWEGTPTNPSAVSSSQSPAYGVLAALSADMMAAPSAPMVIGASTDAKHLSAIADDIYRFWPMTFAIEDADMIHGTNERLGVKDFERMVQFYARFIETMAR